MTAIINTTVGQNRGRSRVWLEGKKLEREGFDVGMKYDVTVNEGSVVLMLSDDGKYMVSKRTRNGRTSPIIDLTGQVVSDKFEVESLIRVVVNGSKIVITGHHSTERQNEREDRLLRKLKSGESLSACSLCHGLGILDSAFDSGLRMSGIKSVISVAVEQEKKYLEGSLNNNPQLWDSRSCVIESPIESVNLMKNPAQVDTVIIGLPCTGFSRGGKSKLKLDCAESHNKGGSVFFYLLSFVQIMNPSIVLIECVPELLNSVSMIIIRSVLKGLGYTTSERILEGNEYGALENRKRACVVAVSNGIADGYDIENIKPLRQKEPCIGDVLESIPLDADCWKPFDYLVAKEARDKAAGKGFARQIVTGIEPQCGVITRGYFKCRSGDVYLAHPKNKKLSRLFTVSEHCKLKTIPRHIVRGLSQSTSHEALGQSVVYEAFKAVGVHLANHLNNWSAQY
jgi:DNA (cytosine-5)-methyltransferase 1